MAEEIECSYFDEDIVVPELPSTPKKKSTLEHLTELYPNKKQHMQILLKTYKLCFPKKSSDIFSKNPEDLLNTFKDMKSMPSMDNLENLLKEQKDALFEYANKDKILELQLMNVPIFIDSAFVYYVWCFDEKAPVYKLPTTGLRFNMITDALGTTRDELNNHFFSCIDNKFIKDLRIETPPYMMRTALPLNKIQKKLDKIVKPIFKKILEGLFKLDKYTYVTKEEVSNVLEEPLSEEPLSEEPLSEEPLSEPLSEEPLSEEPLSEPEHTEHTEPLSEPNL